VDVTFDFAALLVERSQPFIQPGRAVGKIRFNEWMDNIMNQSTAASGNIHD
jgi:hypothetical protein